MNEHLNDQDIIAFVEASDMSPETMELLSRVTTHMVRCEKCLERVKAFQRLYGQIPMKEKEEELRAKEKELELRMKEFDQQRKETAHEDGYSE